MSTLLRTYLRLGVLILLIAYFAVQALTGERGLLNSEERDRALDARARELAALNAERADLEVRARLLRHDSLSADLLEERARALTGLAREGDYLIRPEPPSA